MGPWFKRSARAESPASWVDRHSVLVALGATLASVIVLIATVAVLISSREEAIAKARRTSANVAVALARDMSRNLEIYDLSLQAVVDGMADPTILKLPPELRRQILFDRSTTAAYISGIYALDERGRIVQGRARLLPTVDLSDRDYFTVHRANPNVGLFISKPYASRLRNGAPSIALSRRISKADGSFGGVALISINLDYFQQLVDDIRLGHESAATIVQSDGDIVARNPKLRPGSVSSIRGWPIFSKMFGVESGSFDARSPVDNVDRIMTFARVRGSNLVMMVALGKDDVTSEWQQHSLIIGTLVVAVAGAFTIVVWLLVFAVRQRDAAQAKLVEIADTDGLTGVANRRKLDAALDELWTSAAREGYPVALLFVDADRFKAYNDTHGHEAGDRALQFIAECLVKHARGPHDLVARYGGEEFVVALADCTRSRAEAVAEAMRIDVANSNGARLRQQFPPTTVSIGVVVARPDSGSTIDDAMRRADEALYVSKSGGRNRVTLAAVSEKRRGEPVGTAP
ncbi:sensor domain-containing diguanylate cyclase [Caballeronia sp. GAWG1-1]|uniref:GGDEF domain-containing protein n=1 Tax=Caballeronia sp. GAWG1-1 TaxID=2921742 RepID=UPI00202938AA|nr:sensor domain-containing diguanylate cyclase [Caballeronia sp. GAWG1-1]